MDLKATADRIARTITHRHSWEQLRDVCDIATGGQLDAFQLDLLTDEVERRLENV